MAEKNAPLSIFLAVDGSEQSRLATEILCSLPLPQNTQVVALAVLDTPHTLRRQLLLAALADTQEILNKQGLLSEVGLLHGNPAEALTAYADEHRPDLIVMGAKGLRATLGILLGGVAQQVIEYARWPVLVTRPPFAPIKRLLAVTDGSSFSQKALEFCTRFPFPEQTEIHLVTVVSPMPEFQLGSFSHTILTGTEAIHPLPAELVEEVENWQEQAEVTAKNLLREGELILKKSELPVKTKLLHGDAATEILNYNKEIDAQVIVAGSRGLNPVKGWLLGSVSHKIVHYATCSVLIVRDAIEQATDR